MRVKTKAMAIRGDISGVTAPTHTRIRIVVYAGSESLANPRQEDSPDAGYAAGCEISETVPRVISGKNKEIFQCLIDKLLP